MEKITQIISFKKDYSKWFRCLCCFLFLIIGEVSLAQANIYSFAQSNGTYTAVTGGTVINTATDGTPSLDSYVSSSITLPTAFTFAGTSYTTMYVTSNGQIQLGGASAPSAFEYKVLSSSTGNNVFIAPFSADLGVGAAGTATMRWEQVGDEIVIQWTNFRRWAKTESFNFQARLNTTNGVIKFVYDGTPPYAVSTDYQPQLGIKSSTTAYNCLTVGTTGNWNTPAQITTGISSSAIATFNGPIGFTSGLTYIFSPPLPCSGTPVAGTISGGLTRTVCSGSAPGVIDISGATLAVPGISYQWEESINNGVDWVNAVGGAGATTTSYTPPNYGGTPIQYRLKVTCANGGGFAVSDVLSVGSQAAPSTQATALTVTPADTGITSFSATWTNGNGGRRQVYVSTSAITDPVNATGVTISASAAFANTGQQLVYDGTGTSVTVTGLSCNTAYYVKVYEYNRCGSNPYDVYYNTTTDTNTLTVTTGPTTTILPVTNNFTDFTVSNLSAAVPGWYEANGTTNVSLVPVEGNSDWRSSTVLPSRTAKVNLYDDAYNVWIISPKMEITANSRLKFKAAITAYDTGNAHANKMAGTDDQVNILVSTDGCGAVWTVIHTFNAANTVDLTNVLTDFTLPLNYSGQTIQIAFQGVDGPTNDTPDYDFHIGSIVIEQTPQCDVPVVANPANVTKNGVTVSWTAPTVGIPTEYQYVVSTTATPPAGAGTPVAGTIDSVDLGSLLSSTDYYVYVRTVCGSDFSDWSAVQTFTTLCDYPDITGTTPDSVCGQGEATLAAAASGGTITWFAEQTGGAPLATGATFETPVLTENTTYYVTSVGTGTAQGGGARPSTTATGGTTPLDYGLVFDAYTGFLLNSVDVYLRGTTADELIIVLTDSDGEEIETITVNVPAGNATTPVQHTIALGWTIPAGTGYRLLAVDGPSMVRESALGGFPYPIGDAGLITDGYIDGTSTTYYFFYNWNFTAGCSGPRVPVVATVTDAPDITVTASEEAICLNESTDINVSSANADYTYVWMPGNLSGAEQTVTPIETTTYTVTATDAISGCVEVGEITVTVNSLPVIGEDFVDMEVCEGGTQALTFVANIPLGAVSGTSTTASTAQSTGAALGPNPLQNYWGGVKQQWLYTAAELTAMGFSAGSQITALSIDLATANTTLALSNFSIKMKNTPQAAFATTTSWITEMVTVKPAASYTPVVGVNNFTLITPFTWDGTSNIAVQMSFSNSNAPIEGTNSAKYSTTAFVSTIYYRTDNTAATAMESFTGTASYTYSTRNNVTFTFSSPVPTTWAPVTNLYTNAAATIPYTGTNAAIVYTKPTGDITYTATGTSGAGCTVASTADITITVTPAPTALATQSLCGTATVANLAATGTDVKWYVASTGGTALAPTVGLSDGMVYYASQTIDGCESMARTAVTADVNITAPPAIAEEVQEFCNTATIADLDATGTDVLWYDAPTGGTALAGTDVIAEGISLYYASQTVAGCESSTRAAVAVFVNVTDAPVADIAQTVCNAGTVADLITTSGEGILWYEESVGGTALADDAVLVDGESYFASQTIGVCESIDRAEVVVTINVVDAPEASIAQTVCNAGTVADLTTTLGEGILWYDDATGGTALADIAELVDGESYFASQTVDGCEGLARAEVIVTINVTAAPEAPLTQTFCNAGTVADLETISGTNILWYADAEGGTALESSTALADGETYFASQTIDGCEGMARFEVSVEINVVNAPTGEDIQEVATDSTIEAIVINDVTGTVTWYATLEDAQAATNPIAGTTVLEDGENYFATQTIDGCTSADIFEVTIDVALDTREFDSQSFTYYPNPVKDVIKVSYSSNIDEITVYNLLGQPVMSQKFNALEARLDMSNLADGTYMLNVTSDSMVKTVKIIKKQ